MLQQRSSNGANSLPILLALQFFAFSISRVLIAVTFRDDCAKDPLLPLLLRLFLILGHKSEPHSVARMASTQHFICHRHRHPHHHHHHHYQQRHRHDHCHFRFCVTTSSAFDGFISLHCAAFPVPPRLVSSRFVLGQRVASKS